MMKWASLSVFMNFVLSRLLLVFPSYGIDEDVVALQWLRVALRETSADNCQHNQQWMSLRDSAWSWCVSGSVTSVWMWMMSQSHSLTTTGGRQDGQTPPGGWRRENWFCVSPPSSIMSVYCIYDVLHVVSTHRHFICVTWVNVGLVQQYAAIKWETEQSGDSLQTTHDGDSLKDSNPPEPPRTSHCYCASTYTSQINK